MRKTLAAAAFLALSAGAIGVQALDLKGSDTLRSLTTQVLNACPGATGVLAYKGGGSGAGEGAIVANFPNGTGAPDWTKQQLAPMSRFLAGSPGSGVCVAGSMSAAEGIEVAGDDVGVWFAGVHQLSCDPGSVSDSCFGYSDGGVTYKLPLACGVTITDWKDVLRLIYFGLRPSDFPLPTLPADPNSEVSAAAVGRRDCRDACRDELRNNFGSFFQNQCGSLTGGCTKLQHAFRRDENSGTTDFFRESLVVEGAANFGNKGFPFCNEYIPRVTQNVGNFSAALGACTAGTACTSPYPAGYVGQADNASGRRPNNGCTLSTTNNDCHSNVSGAHAVCDQGQLLCAKTCKVDGDCSALGTGARCEANTVVATASSVDHDTGFCIKAVDGCKVNADCAPGFSCDQNANGGTCAPTCSPAAKTCTAGTCAANAECGSGGRCSILNGASAGTCVAGSCSAAANCGSAGDGVCSTADQVCGAYLPGATCASVPTGGTACTRTYGTVCPVPGLVAAPSTNGSFGGTVAGELGVARGAASFGAVGFENQQDNDTLRWTAVGVFGLNLAGIPDVNPAEQVASACSDLGLVLPISEPPVNAGLPVDPAVFPTVLCGKNKVALAPATKIQGGLDTRYLLCPNGDMPLGATWDAASRTAKAGTGNCLYPQQAGSSSFQCLNGSNSRPGARFYPPLLTLPATPDGRTYNLHLFGASAAHAQQPYLYVGGAQPVTPPLAETESQITQNVVSAFYRIHSTRTLAPGVDALCSGKEGAPGICCAETADTQQIGCLVAASPCSLGFAGLAAGTVALATGGNCSAGACTASSQCGDGGMCVSGACAAGACADDSQCGTSGGVCAPATQAPNFAAGLNTSATGSVVSPNGPSGCIPPGPLPRRGYPVARDLFVNSLVGFETAPAGDPQLTLLKCLAGTTPLSSGTLQSLIATNGFVSLPNYPCCRDFTQEASCGQPATASACANNPAGIPNTVCSF